MLRSAFCVLRNEDRILLYLRDNKPYIPDPGHWALLGGRLKEDETPSQGIERELREEIDCQVYNLAYVDKILEEAENYPNKETLFLFKGDVNTEIKDIKLFEGQRLGYFTFEEFKDLKVSKIIKDYIIKNKHRLFG